MIRVNRQVRLEWKNNPSSFELRNKDAFQTDFLRLGSAIRPVNELLSRSEEMRVLLPSVVGISPIDNNWQERISTYLHDFLLEVPMHGLTFDTSYVFDMEHNPLKANIDALKKKHEKAMKDAEDPEKVLLAIIQKLPETEMYKYVTFINIPDYISWRYCLLSSKVANKVEDIDKSVNIQFYLSSDDERKALQASRTKLRTKAMTKYTELANNDNAKDIDAIVVASNRLSGYNEFKSMSSEDKLSILLEMCDSNPADFIALVDDKNIVMKARIQTYIWMNLLRVLPNSSIIVDASNPERIIGNNIVDAISYFNNELNKAYTAELAAKYNSLK